MLEHVGRENYPELGRVIHRAIGDTGRGFLHFIGRNRPQPFSVWIRKRIFPGAYAPTLRESMEVLEPQNYSVLDVENLRMHYAKTLEHWLARFEAAFDTVVRKHGMEFARMWRLYLAGSIATFRAGNLQLFQVLFAGSRCQSIPWTREHLYAPFSDEAGHRTMDACDVAIVGGGPAGSSCAWALRDSGLDVLVVDRATFPRHKLCGGWITPAGARRTRIHSRGLFARPHHAAHHRLPPERHRRTAGRSSRRARRQLRHSPLRVR